MGKKGKYNKNNQQEEEEPRKKKIMITEEHLMDKTHMDPTNFIPLIAQDSLYPPFNVGEPSVLRNAVKDLNYLIFLDFKNFWATLLYNPSLKNCLNSCHKYLHRKWLADYYSVDSDRRDYYQIVKDRDEFELTSALAKVLLTINFRMLSAEQQNSELTKLYRLEEEISNKFLLDFPRMMELIEIYGTSNPDTIKTMVKMFLRINPNFYSEFTGTYMDIILDKMNRDLNVLKKIGDREEFGIEYSYKRNSHSDLSPGEQELQRKVCLLMQFVSFYNFIDNVYEYFPQQIGEYTRFNEPIHNLNENVFIQIEQAYKTWNNHEMGNKIYPLMNYILSKIINFFVSFLQECDQIFVKRNVKSNTAGAYLKCLDRMMQFYGRRASLGKKNNSKKYMDLYRQILKKFPLDEFLSQVYVDEIQNGTNEINMEYLVDFKLAVDEEFIKMNGGRKEIQDFQGLGQAPPRHEDDDAATEAGLGDNDDIDHPVRKQSYLSHKSHESFDALDRIVSKKNREDNYYEKLYSDYRVKYTAEYDDEYDDLVDYQKRPMFEDNAKEEADSSDASFDSEEEKLHLVKSFSNVSRNRAHLMGQDNQQQQRPPASRAQQKYDRKNKVKYIPAKNQQVQKYINKDLQAQDKKEQEKKEQKQTKNDPTSQYYNREYDDEQCFQDCKVKVKMEQGNNDDGQRGGQGQNPRANKGSRGGHKNDNKGGKPKAKYVAKN